jgi:hypothetical protein
MMPAIALDCDTSDETDHWMTAPAQFSDDESMIPAAMMCPGQ